MGANVLIALGTWSPGQAADRLQNFRPQRISLLALLPGARDLQCAVGRVSHLIGTTQIQRLPGSSNGCRATFGFRHNPLVFALPRREPVIYWVSPYQSLGGLNRSALDCGPGSPRIRALEPDDEDPFTAACLPALGLDAGRCEP